LGLARDRRWRGRGRRWGALLSPATGGGYGRAGHVRGAAARPPGLSRRSLSDGWGTVRRARAVRPERWGRVGPPAAREPGGEGAPAAWRRGAARAARGW